MSVDLFAGISVSDYAAALRWYERLMGGPPAFHPNDIEAVWLVADHGYLYIQHRPEQAGHAMVTMFVENLRERVADVAARGLDPAADETYENGVRKVTYHDPDGNEVCFGGNTAA